MPPFGPIKRRELIQAEKHQFMVKGELKLYIPNPHGSEISRALLAKLLKQGGISRAEWEKIS